VSKISIVIPCYYNEKNIPITTAALLENEKNFPSEVTFEYVFVDDGSGDGTVQELLFFKKLAPERITIVKLAYNAGSYNAIYAGLEHATGDCVVVMAADMQDPPEVIIEMYAEWKKGEKMVLANRVANLNWSAKAFHWILRIFCLPSLPQGGFDYCLFDNEVKQGLLAKIQPNINSLYLLLTLGYPHKTIPYQKRKREIGSSKWTFRKKLKLTLSTLFYFASVKSVVMAYFWRNQAQGKQPFVIDEIL